MTIRSRWARVNRTELVDLIVVEPRHGGGGLGPTYDPPVTVHGRARKARTLLRQPDGEVADALRGLHKLTVHVAPTLTPLDEAGAPILDAAGDPLELAAGDLFALGSRVTAAGVTGYVLDLQEAGLRGRIERLSVTVG